MRTLVLEHIHVNLRQRVCEATHVFVRLQGGLPSIRIETKRTYGRPIRAGQNAFDVLIQTLLLIRIKSQQCKCEAQCMRCGL